MAKLWYLDNFIKLPWIISVELIGLCIQRSKLQRDNFTTITQSLHPELFWTTHLQKHTWSQKNTFFLKVLGVSRVSLANISTCKGLLELVHKGAWMPGQVRILNMSGEFVLLKSLYHWLIGRYVEVNYPHFVPIFLWSLVYTSNTMWVRKHILNKMHLADSIGN